MSRVHRKGQTKNTNVLHLTAKNTIDDDVFGVLKRKMNTAQDVLDRFSLRRKLQQ